MGLSELAGLFGGSQSSSASDAAVSSNPFTNTTNFLFGSPGSTATGGVASSSANPTATSSATAATNPANGGVSNIPQPATNTNSAVVWITVAGIIIAVLIAAESL